ncbi:ligand-binding protein SH3 [Phaeovibrio sulfidiphilus]|uniref:Spermidine export protein MdtI n=2 Tax=Phaeovibrio sulfidiphilus TaxID=1220600 RepID=A0A8J7CCN6_9PROT|nr:ligand-binding protein SH3 [Phaeovibrio sulfidiphilus]
MGALFSLALVAVVAAAGLDIVANAALVKAQGFRKPFYTLAAVALICTAFTGLAYAVRTMDLSVAYALWGGFGILGTSLMGAAFFGQRLRPSAVLGMGLLIGGMTTLHLS